VQVDSAIEVLFYGSNKNMHLNDVDEIKLDILILSSPYFALKINYFSKKDLL